MTSPFRAWIQPVRLGGMFVGVGVNPTTLHARHCACIQSSAAKSCRSTSKSFCFHLHMHDILRPSTRDRSSMDSRFLFPLSIAEKSIAGKPRRRRRWTASQTPPSDVTRAGQLFPSIATPSAPFLHISQFPGLRLNSNPGLTFIRPTRTLSDSPS